MDKKKEFKDQNIISIQHTDTSYNSHTEFESQFDFPCREQIKVKTNVAEQALDNIMNIHDKTRTIRKVADVKHQEIQTQFKELRERLHHSSECLQRMQKEINNIKFSYQNKVYELQNSLTPGDYFDPKKNPIQTKEDMADYMEEIQAKIKKIQNQVYAEKEKHQNVIASYKDAFENISSLLENIDSGKYSSYKVENNKTE